MTRNRTPRGSALTPSAERFVPRFDQLEDRVVPANFFVDPALAGQVAGATVTFNASRPDAVPNLKYAATVADWQADTTRTAFSNLTVALQVTELNAGADTVRLARSTTPMVVDNANLSTDVGGGVLVNSFNVTQQLDIVGSGAGSSIVVPTAATMVNTGGGFANDPDVGIFRVSGAAAKITASNFTLDANGFQTGYGFVVRVGATGTFDGVVVQNTIFDAVGATSGIGIFGDRAASLTVTNSIIQGYGRSGVTFTDTATGKITGSAVTGRGSAGLINNGIEVIDNSTVLISGNTVTGNTGSFGGSTSSGVIIFQSTPGTGTTKATLIGNAIVLNGIGIAVGTGAGDMSVVDAQYNSIAGNGTGADGTNSATQLSAPNNFWGNATGPFAATNPTGTGDNVTTKVAFTPFLTIQTPAESVATTAEYLTAITTIGASVTPATTPVVSGNVVFNVTFAQAVTGFDKTDVTIANGAGGTPVVAVTGNGTTYQITVSGLSGFGNVSASIINRAATAADGSLTAASGLATVRFGTAAIIGTAISAQGTGPGTAVFNVTFAQPVTGFDASKVTVTNGASGTATISVTGSGANYTVTVAGLSGFGPVSAQIVSAAGTTADGLQTAASGTATVTFGTPPLPPLPPVPPTPTPVRFYAVGTDAGAPSEVQVYGLDGTARFRILAFEAAYTGGVRVAVGDVNGDGTDDIIVGAAAGGGPRVRVYDGVTGSQIANFFAFSSAFTGGVYVATADTDGDGKDEVIVSAGPGAGPHVKVFSGTGSELRGFFAFQPTFLGGVTVAGGDVDGDGKDEIIAAAAAGGGPSVQTFNGLTGELKNSFFAFAPTFSGGVFVATGDLNGDGKDEIIAAAGPGGGPSVAVFTDGKKTDEFYAYAPSFTGGSRVTAADTNNDGKAEILTVPGANAGPVVKVFDRAKSQDPISSTFAFDGAFRGGLFIG